MRSITDAPKNTRRQRAGFTLVELLLCVAIMSLLAFAAKIGIDLSTRTQRMTAAQGETRLLASSIAEVLREELRFATNIKLSPENPANTSAPRELVSYTSNRYGSIAKLALENDMLVIKTYTKIGENETFKEIFYPLGETAYGKKSVSVPTDGGTEVQTFKPLEGGAGYSITESKKSLPSGESPPPALSITYNSSDNTFDVKFTVVQDGGGEEITEQFTVKRLNVD